MIKTDIYHITHMKNLQSILQSGGLLANSKMRKQQINYVDIAHQSIQDRRSQIPVTCSAGGRLTDYVPFYFAPRSPMLYAINKGNVAGYREGQTPILHLVAEAEAFQEVGIPFALTDGHAVMAYSEFFDHIEDMYYQIDWELMESKYWFDTEEDPDRNRRRQAEFLVYQFCPWNLIREIGVINNQICTEISQILDNFKSKTTVRVQRSWYY